MASHDVAFGHGQAGGGQRFLVAFAATQAGGDGRSGDVGDAAAAAIDQVLGGDAADGFIVGADIRGVHGGEAAVDQHVGNSARFDAFKDGERGGRLRGGQQQAIDLAAEETIDFARLQVRRSLPNCR